MGFPATSPRLTNLNWPTKVPLWVLGTWPPDAERKRQSLDRHLYDTPCTVKGVGESGMADGFLS